MATQTILYIILAGIIALSVSLFYYFYKRKSSKQLVAVFTLFRFLSLFAVFLLLLNPQYKQVDYKTVKPVLAIGVDNTSSIAHLDKTITVKNNLDFILKNESIQDRFDIDVFSFGAEIKTYDSLAFAEKQTDIAQALKTFDNIYRKRTYVPLLITDGNTTLGEDYRYTAQELNTPILSIAVGDTITYDDIQLDRINVNKYAYEGNEFPVEVITSYAGDKDVSTTLKVTLGEREVYRETIDFTTNENSQISSFYLPAGAVGVKQYKVTLTPAFNEKNTENNSRNFGIEVIDQKTDVLLVYGTLHPDIGALKKAITSNELRSVTVKGPNFDTSTLNDYELVILYQPNEEFDTLYKEIALLEKNTLTIIGPSTIASIVNNGQSIFEIPSSSQTDEAQAILNENFSSFQVSDINFQDLPPLDTFFEEIKMNTNFDIMLYQKITGVDTQKPLLALTENNNQRNVLITGAGIWKWRAYEYRNSASFERFDNFIDQIIQYAASSEKKERLTIDNESFYYGSDNVTIKAHYVDQNYIFSPNASITIRLKNEENDEQYVAPLVVKGNRYEVNLKTLQAGTYTFTVAVDQESISKSGTFTIIPYEVENQFSSANWDKLQRVAEETNGLTVTTAQENRLIKWLETNKQLIPIQEPINKTSSLIDFKILLFIIIACLSIEWFLRKYNGLI